MTVRVLAFVEGQTEEKFTREIIAPELASRSVLVTATTPGRKRSQGGVQSWPRIRKELVRYLREYAGRFVTMMFDYYGMPTNWPGRNVAAGLAHEQKAATVEDAIAEDILSEMGNSFDSQRFIPYVQMHEFEALLFSDPVALGEVIPENSATPHLQSIADGFSTPEEINDDPVSAPSKRILRISNQYQKVVHGNIAAKRIGLNLMREKCPHFNEWLKKLERLAARPSINCPIDN